MKLIDLIEGINNLEIIGKKDIPIEGVTSFSKNVKKNYLFAAIPGFKTDGFLYLEEAIKNGATAFLLPKNRRKDLDKKNNFTYLFVDEIRKVYSLICKNFYGQVDNNLILIGITGTQGKTTTTYLVKHILNSFDIPTGLIGTINHFDGENWIKSLNTTPESEFIYSLLSKLYKNNIKYCVMEVSSHALALDRVYGLNFSVAGLTNLGHDHLDFHKNIENYKKSKRKLFEYLKINGWAIINIDDDFGKELIDELNKKSINVITYGIDSSSLIKGEILKTDLKGMEFIVKINDKEIKGKTKIFGKFNLYNILLSLGIAKALGFKEEDILKKVEEFKGVPGRLERVENGLGINAFVDYAHTPESLREVLKTLRSFSKKLILVFGCGGERDREKRPLMGKV
ncbi:MAG: UDP-N-acetylmuramoyl-L-alanyl-D-glutamate--2,6-diaminopimelate ligase, partial [candidate division WOR-3 bacterium]|nr:UDP-N-acetylmuramoyl-L-alanyl-D-glutamate--2,6-diaminopimelate ligase [candidate division WOR-3 bacterium]